MRITVMCAVPTTRMDYGPGCADGRGGQIYHGATPGFYVKSPSRFSVGAAVSFLLEYGPEDVEVSHLEYVVGTARMSGDTIGKTRIDFALNPYEPRACESDARRFATYENIPSHIECSCNDFGLIELSWALKVDTHTEPVDVDQCAYVRSWTLPAIDEAISSEEYDAWQMMEIASRTKQNRRNGTRLWRRIIGLVN